MALEVRRGDRARSTRDLDLALREAAFDGGAVRVLLIDCLLVDHDSDGFEFRIGNAGQITADDAGRPGWRFSVEGRLAGRRFATVRLDIVARNNNIARTQRVSLPGILDFAAIARHTVEVVDPLQHFAEKIHTLTRTYGDRPNSRVRDLADIVLLIEDGLHPTPELLRVVAHVFDERNMHPLPHEIADPPAFWRESYPTLVADMDLTANNFDQAVALVRRFWNCVLAPSTAT